MTHRTSLQVQANLNHASKLSDDAARALFASPIARRSQHLLPQDYAEARNAACLAIAELRRAIALMDDSARVAWVGADGKAAKRLPADFMYERSGDVVRNVPHTAAEAEKIRRTLAHESRGVAGKAFNAAGEAVSVFIPGEE